MTKTAPALTIRQLRAIDAVATHASLARASEQLNTSQSSLSRHVAEAERAVGHRLFQRGWIGMEPTSQGEIVITVCRRAIAIIAAAQAELRAAGAPVAELSHRLTWPLLTIVDAVRETGSVSAAAAFLGLSQPDVSRALGKLTAAVGREPFQRTRRGMAPTPDAAVLGKLHARLLAEFATLPDRLEALAGEMTGRVAVGLLPFSEQNAVAKAFGRMLERHPHVRLQAVTGSYAALADGLRRGELDAIIGPLRNPPPFDDLEEARLLDETFSVVLRAGHPLASAATLADLVDEKWVVAPHGTPTRQYFEALLTAAGLTPPVHTCEIVTFFLAEQVLLNSDAVGLLTYSDRKRAAIRGDLRVLPIPLPDNVRTIGLTTRKEHGVSPAQQVFVALLTDQIEGGAD